MQCKEIEILMYLKEEELSREEGVTLENHLKDCEDCRKQYEEINIFLNNSQFDNHTMNSRFMEERLVEDFEKIYSERKTKRIIPLRRQLLKALSIASVFFFIIFSVEQLNTVRKISDLEQKLAITEGKTFNHQGQVLVLNHFYDMDDLKQIINSDFLNQKNPDSGFLNSNTVPSFKLFNNGDEMLLKKLLQSSSFSKAILNREFYGNSQLLNISFE